MPSSYPFIRFVQVAAEAADVEQNYDTSDELLEQTQNMKHR
jgi:hypothetical protein